MTYIDRLNAFYRWLESHALPVNAQLMYLKILDVFNRAGWPDSVQIDNLRLMNMIQASKGAAMRARDCLVAAGLIAYSKGHKGVPNKYRLLNETINGTINDTISGTTNETKSETTSGTHIKTKTKSKKTSSISPPGGVNLIFVDYAGDDKELLELLGDFEKMRDTINAPMTERARKNLCSELDKLSRGSRARKIAILNKSILQNWKGVFPLKGEEEEEIAVRDNIFHAPD